MGKIAHVIVAKGKYIIHEKNGMPAPVIEVESLWHARPKLATDSTTPKVYLGVAPKLRITKM